MEIYMEFMEGRTLGQSWKQMTPPQRLSAVRQLEGFIAQLRAIPQPPHLRGMICSATGGKNCDRHIWIDGGFGPFATLKDARDWQFATYDEIGKMHERNAFQLQELRQAMSDDEPIVFTHGDINWQNVLVRLPEDDTEEVEITAVIDWEQAGWRPRYWEAFKVNYMLPRPTHEWSILARSRLVAGYQKQVDLENTLGSMYGPFGCGLSWPDDQDFQSPGGVSLNAGRAGSG